MTLEEWRSRARKFDYDGHTIACWLGGDAKARPLVLVHGFPTSSFDWAQVWQQLGQDRGLVAADMLGFGLSDKPRDGFDGHGYSIHRQADLHEALIEQLGIDEFDLLVHDYGVSVGQELLARQQDGSGAHGLGHVWFLNGGIFPDQHRPRPIQKLGTSRLGPLVGKLMTRASFGKSFSEVFGPNTQPSEEELDDYWTLIARKGGHRLTHKLLHYIADRREHEERWVGALRAAAGRVGFINGALDPVSGRHAYDKWRATVPQAKHHLIGTVGHYPQVEAPMEVIKVLRDWFR
ncbi:Haloacetate dehalogenase [Alteripontixanthobacter maritimus]|uniref:Haloacetate dehalogenase n=1 Tax=Alteripontixanthobacter maritimus TaxID=2161824 RepID=A0A369QD09_9SPHN|nr:alpha/beta hydrolase [Alteripontixanthobacter maritimus]RDC60168.1 Haloacetate dehalogenase [Alteripontixanthobacter maritimus]